MTQPNLSKGKDSRFEFLNNNQESLNPQNNPFMPSDTDAQSGSQTPLMDDYSNIPVKQPAYQSPQHNNFNHISSEVDQGLLLDDGVYKSEERVLSRGQKLNQNSGYRINDQGADKPDPSRFVKKGDNSDINRLRKKVGFNWQSFWRKAALTSIVFVLFFVLILAGVAAWAINQYNAAQNISEGNLFKINESSIVYARDGKTKIYEFFGRKEDKREYVKIDRIPEVMQLAIVGLEDENFYYNPDGIPYSSIAKAILECLQSLVKDCRGASGLTQQLVKNVQQDAEGTTDRKIRELFTAIKLYQEGTTVGGQKLNKSDILELYLNWVPFGRNSSGIQQASRSYFGHDIDAREDPNNPESPYLLNPPKACFLASLVQQQSIFSASIGKPDSEAWKEYTTRKNNCLYKLAGDGKGFSLRGDGKPLFIPTIDEYEKWKNVEVQFAQYKFDDPYPHFREYINQEIIKFLKIKGLTENDLNRRGLKIVTTLDPEIQSKVETVVKDNRAQVNKNGGDNASALTIDGPTGQILAMVGSVDYYDEAIQGKNNIMLSLQQPGSSMKPYVYTNLFDKGFNPGTVLMDAETKFLVDPNDPKSVYTPSNFGQRYRGPVSIHSALSNSLNIPAVKAGFLAAGANNYNLKNSLDAYFGFTENIGVRYSTEDETGPDAPYRDRCYAGSFIGGCELTGITHVTGINTLLQEGNLRTAVPFISIKDKNNQELFTNEDRQKLYPSEDKRIKPEIAREIASIMSDQNRPAFQGLEKMFTIPGWNLAAKTGTTDQNIDTWMVGGSPYFTTVVWAGRTDNKPMNQNIQAANVAGPIWSQIQAAIHQGKTPKAFSTEGLTQVAVDPISGFPNDKSSTKEWMSPEQLQQLKDAGAKIAKPEYDPRKQTIIENRSAVISRVLKINKLDGKIAVDGKTLPENVAETACYDFLGEYPSIPNWRDPAEAWGAKSPNKCGAIEISTQDQVADKSAVPVIDTNVTSGKALGSSNTVNFSSPVVSKTIKSASIFVNGVSIKSIENNTTPSVSLSFTNDEVASAIGGPGNVTVVLSVVDSAGQQNSKTISNVIVNNKQSNPNPTPNPSAVQITLSPSGTINPNQPLVIYIDQDNNNIGNLAILTLLSSSSGNATQCTSTQLVLTGTKYKATCTFGYAQMRDQFDKGDTLSILEVSGQQITDPVKYNGQ
jgi:membrane peptidoglycan carboxypeptidase